MIRRFPLRTLFILLVWVASAGAAIWLHGGGGRSTSAPAQVVAQEYRIAPVETGRLANVLVVAGQTVRAGQVVAVLDTSVQEREIAVAEAKLRQLGAETHASAAVMESDGYEAERRFQADAEEVASELEAARVEHGQQSAELAQLKEELYRQRQYVREGLAKRDRADELELKQKTIENAVAQWPARIELLIAKQHAAKERLAEWRSKYSALSAPSQRQTRVRPNEDRIAEQTAALRVLRTRMENAKIKAPVEGQVVSVLARAGDVVRAGDLFIVMNGSSAREVIAYLPERDGRIPQTGDPALLRRRTISQAEYPSKVVRTASALTPLPSRFWLMPQLASWGREVVVELPPGATLDPGEALDVIFIEGSAR